MSNNVVNEQFRYFMNWVKDADNGFVFVSDPRNYPNYITPYRLDMLIRQYGKKIIAEAISDIDNRMDLWGKCNSFAYQIGIIAEDIVNREKEIKKNKRRHL